MLTEKDYCDYETCVALKELGYDEPCEGYYHLTDDEDYNQLSFEWCYDRDFLNSLNKWRAGVPMLCDAQKWLREEKKIEVLALSKGMVGAPYYAQIYTEDYVIQEGIEYNSYEEALLEGIKEAVKILKENETIHG